MNIDSLRYAGFWPRLGAMLLDGLILGPVGWLSILAGGHHRLYDVYTFIPFILLGLFYNVYLVRRFGGTPGKLIVGIRIRKVNGDPVGYREAILRELPDTILNALVSFALLLPLFQMTDAEYASLSFTGLYQRQLALAPAWYKPANWAQNIWFWSELVVLLTNRKRRALHDFIAGTVVVHVRPKTMPKTPAIEPAAAG